MGCATQVSTDFQIRNLSCTCITAVDLDHLRPAHAGTDGNEGADLCAKIADFGLHAALDAFEGHSETTGKDHLMYSPHCPLTEIPITCYFGGNTTV